MDEITRRKSILLAATAWLAVPSFAAAAQPLARRAGKRAFRERDSIPSDDPRRELVLANPSGARPHVAIAGGTYTILLSGAETGGRYTLIDMHVPPGAGPPPHRHDFEEMFTVLEGEASFTFRGKKNVAVAGDTVNIPANAPHSFVNASNQPARLLCMCTPAGQDEFFLAIGDRVATRTSAGPLLSPSQLAERLAKTRALAPKFKTELLQ